MYITRLYVVSRPCSMHSMLALCFKVEQALPRFISFKSKYFFLVFSMKEKKD